MVYSKDDLWPLRVEVLPARDPEPQPAPLEDGCGNLSEAITPYFATPGATAWRRHYRSFRVGKTSGAHGEAPAEVEKPQSSSRRVNAREAAQSTVRPHGEKKSRPHFFPYVPPRPSTRRALLPPLRTGAARRVSTCLPAPPPPFPLLSPVVLKIVVL